MTSMPLTFSKGALMSASALALSRRPSRQLLLTGVLVGSRLHHRLEQRLVRLVPVGAEVPLLAVPGVHPHRGRPLVVEAAGADRTDHAGEAQGGELLVVQRQVLQ